MFFTQFLSPTAKKESKGIQFEETAHFLEKRIGSTEDHKDNSNGPLCKGSYNSTEGLQVQASRVYSCMTMSLSFRPVQWPIIWRPVMGPYKQLAPSTIPLIRT